MIIPVLAGLTTLLWFFRTAHDPSNPLLLNLDDGYIHARIAEVFTYTGVIGINPNESGGGSSSLLWTSLLVLMTHLGVRPDLSALLLGVICWLGVLFLLSLLAERWFSSRWAVLVPLVAALNGHLLAIAQSGMETHLAVLLVLWALYLRVKDPDDGYQYFIVGLASLARPEIILLLASFILGDLIRSESSFYSRVKSVSLKAISPVLITLAGLFLLRFFSGGWPSMLTGRRWLIGLPSSPFADFSVTFTAGFHFLVNVAVRVVNFIGPGHGFGVLWGICIAFLFILGMGVCFKDRRKNPVVLFILFHSLFYFVFLPTEGHFGRYLAIDGVFSILLIFEGWLQLQRIRPALKIPEKVMTGIIVLLLLGYLPQFVKWNRWNHDAYDHLYRLHYRMARTINEMDLGTSRVAALDIGILSYFGRKKIVDLGALSNPKIAEALYKGQLKEILFRYDVQLIVLPGYRDQLRSMMIKRYGLVDLNLREVLHYQLDEKVLSHLRPTLVAFPALTLYQWP